MLDVFERSWLHYQRLEKELTDSVFYVPLVQNHKKVWSEFFGDLIVRVGNSVDSLFRIMLEDKTFDTRYPHVTILSQNKKRKKDINYFRDFFEPIYRLSEAEIKVKHRLTSYGKTCPFEGFKSNKVPKWWTAYNHGKHQWFKRIEEATLENTINALGGLFVLIILHKGSQQFLIENENIISCDFQKNMPKSYIVSVFNQSMIGIPKELRNYSFMAKTPLFTHIFRIDENATATKYIG